jgi:DNA-directed RNA polymerase
VPKITVQAFNKADASAILRGRNSRSLLAGCLQVTDSLRTLEQQQLARQRDGARRAKEARESQQRRLKEMGKESSLDYGQKLFSMCVDAVADHIGATFEEFLLNPDKARPHASALPFFDTFSGVHHIAAVALTAAIDQLSRRQRIATFYQHLGAAIERECRLIKLGKRSALEMRRLMRTGMTRRQISSRDVMAKLQCPVAVWSDQTRLQVGAFLSEAIFATELLTAVTVKQGHRTPRYVVPTKQAEHFIKNTKPKTYTHGHLAMLVPPTPWPGLYGGGVLDNDKPLIKPVLHDAGEESALDHFKKADLTIAIKGVNALQTQRLRCSAEIVSTQRITWEGGFEGLWPCSRTPPEIPDRLKGDPTPEEIKTRNRIAAAAYRDQETNRHRRVKVERSLQLAEEIAGRDVWQSWYCDHRGRLYANAAQSTQGPDYEKAQLSFAEQLPVNDEAFEWQLKAAAGHWGMSRCTWERRLSWGRQHIDQMIAAAEDPLGKLELWRGAKDPWQFLQACYGIREVRATGKTGVPVRFDQTTSGCGILSALTRHAEVGRLCNLFGDTPQDLYSVIAEAATAQLTQDLQLGDSRQKALAELWLKRGCDRSLVKGPVLRAPYGGSYMSLCDGLVDELEKHIGYTPIDEYTLKIAIPSKYMASILWREMKLVISPVMEVKTWLRQSCKRVLTKQRPMEWTSPSGWPMRVADREPTTRTINTFLFGKKIGVTIADQPIDAPLSATQANKALAANAVHSFDAAFAQLVVYKAAEQGIPMLANHDCFACHPTNAGKLHELLHWEFGNMHRKPLLALMQQEIEERSGIKIKAPPVFNTLDPMSLGSNPYLFS